MPSPIMRIDDRMKQDLPSSPPLPPSSSSSSSSSSFPSSVSLETNTIGVLHHLTSSSHYNTQAIAIQFHNPDYKKHCSYHHHQHATNSIPSREDTNNGVDSSSSSFSSPISKCTKASNVYWYPWWNTDKPTNTENDSTTAEADAAIDIDSDVDIEPLDTTSNRTVISQSTITSISTITYGTLVTITNLLTKSLRDLLYLQLVNNTVQASPSTSTSTSTSTNTATRKTQKNPPVVVAISIPEGPYLPLAILAVHTLTASTLFHNHHHRHHPTTTTDSNNANTNHTCSSDSRSSNSNSTDAPIPIMLPMDPEEGIHRLKHMILDAKPTLILCAGEETRITTAVRQLLHDDDKMHDDGGGDSDGGGDGNGGEIREKWKPPLILDLDKHLRTLLLTTKIEYPPSPPTTTPPKTTAKFSAPTSHSSSSSSPPTTTKTLQSPSSYPTHIKTTTNINCPSHLVYTSGTTTGQPKGCISSLNALLTYLHAKNTAHSITHQSNVLLASMVPFDPCLSDILSTFYAGGTVCLVERFLVSSGGLGDILAEGGDGGSGDGGGGLGVTHVLCTPSLWNMLPPPASTTRKGGGGGRGGGKGGDYDDGVEMERGEEENGSDNRKGALSNKYCRGRHLEVVALGGEPIPVGIVSSWARKRRSRGSCDNGLAAGGGGGGGSRGTDCTGNLGGGNDDGAAAGRVRLLATYGVTEACVYQTAGEVFSYVPYPRMDDDDDGSINDEENSEEEESSPEYAMHTAKGQDVGLPLLGSKIRICRQVAKGSSNLTSIGGVSSIPGKQPHHHHGEILTTTTTTTIKDAPDGEAGEIILSGMQIDAFSGYWNLPQLTNEQFIDGDDDNNGTKEYFYRTGDWGCIDRVTGHLHILGRKDGEEGMVKINGVRVELGEVEHAIVDDVMAARHRPDYRCMVLACIVVVKSSGAEYTENKKLIAYCVLSNECLEELKISFFQKPTEGGMSQLCGVLCTSGPLLTLLRARCTERVRKGCTPSVFVLIEQVPLTRTGKCDRKSLPQVESCTPLSTMTVIEGNTISIPLEEYGRCGAAVSAELSACLNLQPCQKSLLTIDSSYAVLGGDSLAAIRVVRALYAMHHEVQNSRTLGGAFGNLDGVFSVSHLLRAITLKRYVDFLDSHSILNRDLDVIVGTLSNNVGVGETRIEIDALQGMGSGDSNAKVRMHDALLEAIMLGQRVIVSSLLEEGADPNYQEHGRRLGKMTDRMDQRQNFRSNALHLACVRGDDAIVGTLISHGCNCKSPDANGMYPIHLACSGVGIGIGTKRSVTPTNDMGEIRKTQEDLRRIECVRQLLELGKVPLTMKSSSKQTVLHSAARGGHIRLLQYLMKAWGEDHRIRRIPQWGTKFDCQDRWFRTPVHWAILNGKASALQVLLENGCSAKPPKPKASVGNRSTSGAIESPIEICRRLYDTETCSLGKEISQLLINAQN